MSNVLNREFKKNSLMDKLPELLTIEVGTKKSQVGRKNPPKMLTVDFGEPLDRIEKNMLRSLSGLVLILVVYCGFSILIKNQIEVKNKEADESIKSTTAQISLVNQDIQSLQNKTNEYTNKINNLNQLNQEIEENNKTKKAIPNLLNRLMYVMPSEVQLTSIQNSTSTHIVIQAQSTSYAQLGYLTASIKTNGILQNVISTSGQKENNLVTIKIEGDLP